MIDIIKRWWYFRRRRPGITTTIYYLSGDGNDVNGGKHPLQAWKTIERLNREKMRIYPDDQILFRRGYRYPGRPFYLDQRWRIPIKMGAYGSGKAPEFPDVESDKRIK